MLVIYKPKVNLYEMELEINDFPQNVRFKITTKETLDHLMEYADVFMAVKVIFQQQILNIL